MVSTAFDYIAVDSYEEAVRLLAEHGDDAKIIAGGQSLAPMLNLRLARPEILIDINPVPAPEPAVDGSSLRLSAMTRHRTLLEHPLLRRHSPLIAEAMSHVGNVRVRNRGTIGGSLAHCDPTAELGACALVLDAQVIALGPIGPRTISIQDLFVTYLTTSLEPAEVVTDVLLPLASTGRGWGFQEMVRRTSDFAIVAVAAEVELDGQTDSAGQVRLGLAGVADTVVLVEPALLTDLVGWPGDDERIARAAARVAESVHPDSDIHASGKYRQRLVAVLVRRALREAFDRAKGAA